MTLLMRQKKVISCVLCLLLTLTQIYSQPLYADLSEKILPNVSPLPAIDPFKIKLPESIGKIEDAFAENGDQTVILIQDAHAIPDAQKNIQKLISFFQEEYGVNQVAVEGASGSFEPQIFKSFPEPQKIKKVFKDYLLSGELTGASAAAIFNPQQASYEGIENWNTYEEGYQAYLKAMAKRPELSEHLETWRKNLSARKAVIYPPKLLHVDAALNQFLENSSDLTATLQTLAVILPPEPDSEIALMLAESRRRGDNAAVTAEVRWIAGKIRIACQKSTISAERLKEFERRFQDFQTDQINTQSYALYLDVFLQSIPGLRQQVTELDSKALGKLKEFSGTARRLEAIEGTRFFKDFRAYANHVKESMISGEEQRAIDRESNQLALLKRFAELRLDQEDWEEIKKLEVRSWKLEGADAAKFRRSAPFLFKDHLIFYENAKKRDAVMFKKLLRMFKEKDLRTERKVRGGKFDDGRESSEGEPSNDSRFQTQDALLLIAGGFHTHGITKLLKEKGISYAVIMPAIAEVPEKTTYEHQMLGHVSWSHYFKVENGAVDLNAAFIRGTRDRLLGTSRESSVLSRQEKQNPSLAPQDPRLLKDWRDQIIRDLSEQGRIEQSGNYTRYIDEIVRPENQSPFKKEWTENIKKFMNGMRDLDQRAQLNPVQVRQLLQTFSTLGQPAAYGGLVPGTKVHVDLDRGSFVPSLSAKSEVRQTNIAVRHKAAAAGDQAEGNVTERVLDLSGRLLVQIRSERPVLIRDQEVDSNVINLVKDGQGEFVIEQNALAAASPQVIPSQKSWQQILGQMTEDKTYEPDGAGNATINGTIGAGVEDWGALVRHFLKVTLARQFAEEKLEAGYSRVEVKQAAGIALRQISDENRLMAAVLLSLRKTDFSTDSLDAAINVLRNQDISFLIEPVLENAYRQARKVSYDAFAQARQTLIEALSTSSSSEDRFLAEYYFSSARSSVMNQLKLTELAKGAEKPFIQDDRRDARSEVRSHSWIAALRSDERVGPVFSEVAPDFSRMKPVGDGGFGTVFIDQNDSQGLSENEEYFYKIAESSQQKVSQDNLNWNLLQEAQILRRLQKTPELQSELSELGVSTGIPQVIEAGVLIDGRMWLKMKGLKNVKPLNSRAFGVLSRIQKVDALLRVSKILKAVHDVGILHNDLKDDNILIDSTGHPMLIDWAVAGNVDTEVLLGTPIYSAPEINKNEASDIFSLGKTLKLRLIGTYEFYTPVDAEKTLITPAQLKASGLVYLISRMTREAPEVNPIIGFILGVLRFFLGGVFPGLNRLSGVPPPLKNMSEVITELQAARDYLAGLETQSQVSAPAVSRSEVRSKAVSTDSSDNLMRRNIFQIIKEKMILRSDSGLDPLPVTGKILNRVVLPGEDIDIAEALAPLGLKGNAVFVFRTAEELNTFQQKLWDASIYSGGSGTLLLPVQGRLSQLPSFIQHIFSSEIKRTLQYVVLDNEFTLPVGVNADGKVPFQPIPESVRSNDPYVITGQVDAAVLQEIIADFEKYRAFAEQSFDSKQAFVEVVAQLAAKIQKLIIADSRIAQEDREFWLKRYFENQQHGLVNAEEQRRYLQTLNMYMDDVLSLFEKSEESTALAALHSFWRDATVITAGLSYGTDDNETSAVRVRQFLEQVRALWLDAGLKSGGRDALRRDASPFLSLALKVFKYDLSRKNTPLTSRPWAAIQSLLEARRLSFDGKVYRRGAIRLSSGSIQDDFAEGKNLIFQLGLLNDQGETAQKLLVKHGAARPVYDEIFQEVARRLELPSYAVETYKAFSQSLQLIEFVPNDIVAATTVSPLNSNESALYTTGLPLALQGSRVDKTMRFEKLGGLLAAEYLLGAQDSKMKHFLLSRADQSFFKIDSEYLFQYLAKDESYKPKPLHPDSDLWQFLDALRQAPNGNELVEAIQRGFNQTLKRASNPIVQGDLLALIKQKTVDAGVTLDLRQVERFLDERSHESFDSVKASYVRSEVRKTQTKTAQKVEAKPSIDQKPKDVSDKVWQSIIQPPLFKEDDGSLSNPLIGALKTGRGQLEDYEKAYLVGRFIESVKKHAMLARETEDGQIKYEWAAQTSSASYMRHPSEDAKEDLIKAAVRRGYFSKDSHAFREFLVEVTQTGALPLTQDEIQARALSMNRQVVSEKSAQEFLTTIYDEWESGKFKGVQVRVIEDQSISRVQHLKPERWKTFALRALTVVNLYLVFRFRSMILYGSITAYVLQFGAWWGLGGIFLVTAKIVFDLLTGNWLRTKLWELFQLARLDFFAQKEKSRILTRNLVYNYITEELEKKYRIVQPDGTSETKTYQESKGYKKDSAFTGRVEAISFNDEKGEYKKRIKAIRLKFEAMAKDPDLSALEREQIKDASNQIRLLGDMALKAFQSRYWYPNAGKKSIRKILKTVEIAESILEGEQGRSTPAAQLWALTAFFMADIGNSPQAPPNFFQDYQRPLWMFFTSNQRLYQQVLGLARGVGEKVQYKKIQEEYVKEAYQGEIQGENLTAYETVISQPMLDNKIAALELSDLAEINARHYQRFQQFYMEEAPLLARKVILPSAAGWNDLTTRMDKQLQNSKRAIGLKVRIKRAFYRGIRHFSSWRAEKANQRLAADASTQAKINSLLRGLLIGSVYINEDRLDDLYEKAAARSDRANSAYILTTLHRSVLWKRFLADLVTHQKPLLDQYGLERRDVVRLLQTMNEKTERVIKQHIYWALNLDEIGLTKSPPKDGRGLSAAEIVQQKKALVDRVVSLARRELKSSAQSSVMIAIGELLLNKPVLKTIFKRYEKIQQKEGSAEADAFLMKSLRGRIQKKSMSPGVTRSEVRQENFNDLFSEHILTPLLENDNVEEITISFRGDYLIVRQLDINEKVIETEFVKFDQVAAFYYLRYLFSIDPAIKPPLDPATIGEAGAGHLFTEYRSGDDLSLAQGEIGNGISAVEAEEMLERMMRDRGLRSKFYEIRAYAQVDPENPQTREVFHVTKLDLETRDNFNLKRTRYNWGTLIERHYELQDLLGELAEQGLLIYKSGKLLLPKSEEMLTNTKMIIRERKEGWEGQLEVLSETGWAQFLRDYLREALVYLGSGRAYLHALPPKSGQPELDMEERILRLTQNTKTFIRFMAERAEIDKDLISQVLITSMKVPISPDTPAIDFYESIIRFVFEELGTRPEDPSILKGWHQKLEHQKIYILFKTRIAQVKVSRSEVRQQAEPQLAEVVVTAIDPLVQKEIVLKTARFLEPGTYVFQSSPMTDEEAAILMTLHRQDSEKLEADLVGQMDAIEMWRFKFFQMGLAAARSRIKQGYVVALQVPKGLDEALMTNFMRGYLRALSGSVKELLTNGVSGPMLEKARKEGLHPRTVALEREPIFVTDGVDETLVPLAALDESAVNKAHKVFSSVLVDLINALNKDPSLQNQLNDTGKVEALGELMATIQLLMADLEETTAIKGMEDPIEKALALRKALLKALSLSEESVGQLFNQDSKNSRLEINIEGVLKSIIHEIAAREEVRQAA